VTREDSAKEGDVATQREHLKNHSYAEPLRIRRPQTVQRGSERIQLRDDKLDEAGDGRNDDRRGNRASMPAYEAMGPACF
jgi:hypothetical protein